jgi:hypothetical protein
MTCTHVKLGTMHISICGPEAEGSCVIGGKTWRWDYHEYMGPCFLKANGDPLKNQPGEKHPVWDRFDEWVRKYLAEKEARRAQRR